MTDQWTLAQAQNIQEAIILGSFATELQQALSPVSEETNAKVLTKQTRLGYCGKCGRDVEVDFCNHCQRYVQ